MFCENTFSCCSKLFRTFCKQIGLHVLLASGILLCGLLFAMNVDHLLMSNTYEFCCVLLLLLRPTSLLVTPGANLFLHGITNLFVVES